MAIIRWRNLDNLRNEMDRIYDRYYRSGEEDAENICDCYPMVDIKETKDEFIVNAELPGVSKQDIKINFTDDSLVIEGEKKEEEKDEKNTYHRVERSYGKFYRSFSFPGKVAGDKIKAAYKDGILSVSLPKKEEMKPKEISISVS